MATKTQRLEAIKLLHQLRTEHPTVVTGHTAARICRQQGAQPKRNYKGDTPVSLAEVAVACIVRR